MNCPTCKQPRDPILLRCDCLKHDGLKSALLKFQTNNPTFWGPRISKTIEDDLSAWEKEQQSPEAGGGTP